MKILRMTLTDTKIILKSPKIYILMIFSYFFIHDYSKQFISIAQVEGISVSPYTYPLIVGDWRQRLFVLLIMIMLMSDVPFKHDATLFTLLRCDRKDWFLSKVLLIINTSVMYQLITVVISIVALIPYVGISLQWGDCINSIAGNVAGMVSTGNAYAMLEIISNYNPLQAVVCAFVLATLINILIGMFMFFINEVTKSNLGIMITLIIALFDVFMGALKGVGFGLDVPDILSWMDLSQIYINGFDTEKHYLFSAVFILGCAILGLAVCIYKAIKHRIIEIES